MFGFKKKSNVSIILEDYLGLSILNDVKEYRYKYEKALNLLIKTAKENQLNDFDVAAEIGWMIAEGKLEMPDANFGSDEDYLTLERFRLTKRLTDIRFADNTVVPFLFHLQRSYALSAGLPDSIETSNQPDQITDNEKWQRVILLLASIGWDTTVVHGNEEATKKLLGLFAFLDPKIKEQNLNDYDFAVIFLIRYFNTIFQPQFANKQPSEELHQKMLNIIRRSVNLTFLAKLSTKSYIDDHLKNLHLEAQGLREY